MKIWFDTEFLDDGKTIEPISIGMVREDHATYYAEFAEFKYSRATPWLIENVFPGLHKTSGVVRPRWKILKEILHFCNEGPTPPEFWAYFCSYDWVLLCQLFGRMVDLPKRWPMMCRDVQQYWLDNSIIGPMPAQKGEKHNALDDAIWCQSV